MTCLLEMKGITKRFPGVVANDSVDFNLKKGEIHALLGENGAGKSTLMNILYGMYRPDEGHILLDGVPVQITRPGDVIKLGIGMVHQHFMLIPVMTVTENIILGAEATFPGGFLDLKGSAEKIRALAKKHGFKIDPNARISDLPVGIRQRVEILKSLYRQASILILDEPTAVLTPDEAKRLFNTLTSLTRKGMSIIFITHKLKEVMQFADRITVMRRGKVVSTTTPDQTSQKEIASLMVGKKINLKVSKSSANPGKTVLRIKDLFVEKDTGIPSVNGVCLDIRAGEIFGLAGVHGNGQGDLIQCLTGLKKCSKGSILVNEKEITNKPSRFIFNQGVSHIPEDRHAYGMVEGFPIEDNCILNAYHMEPYSKGIRINRQAITQHARDCAEKFDIRTAGVKTKAGSLSGGNQQKMVVAREFTRPLALLIAAHPTRGVDVGSATFIHEKIIHLRDKGCAVFVISAELDEIFAISDRIGVMYKGQIISTMAADETDLNEVGLLMAGISKKDAAEFKGKMPLEKA